MKRLTNSIVIFGLLSSVLCQDTGVIDPTQVKPKNRDFQESIQSSAYPESTVTITVGDQNGFHYTVDGITHSDKRIAVSGEYLDVPANPYQGYARLFLVVDTGVAYYALRPHGNILDVYIENYRQDEFYYTIICPRQVSSYNLHEGQINATAVLITGPPRSAVIHSRLNLKSVRNTMSRRERLALKASKVTHQDAIAGGAEDADPVPVIPQAAN